MMSFTLADLEKRIDERSRATAEQSYTRSLIDKGPAHCAKKMGEEAFETALAAVAEDKTRFVSEAADLIYHLMVLLKAKGVALAEVEAELDRRAAQSGHAEKASRKV
ncbi:MAG: phosphoribosyl-ATP diphosphatase [Proteobacteria bacterium]|nr:phosphoribosyl-ATP diphosphatase [Pseudomonadota bacterium]